MMAICLFAYRYFPAHGPLHNTSACPIVPRVPLLRKLWKTHNRNFLGSGTSFLFVTGFPQSLLLFVGNLCESQLRACRSFTRECRTPMRLKVEASILGDVSYWWWMCISPCTFQAQPEGLRVSYEHLTRCILCPEDCLAHAPSPIGEHQTSVFCS
ncbi:hypothetical protein H4582DRAFT_779776 [Lactarius indigo]|nr:hypothetical protein H4582DRAFT_779776 [Lactarius indigo]